MLPILGLVLLAYGLGSIPFGYLAGRCKGMDLRAHGSGNIGATNAWRVLGKGWGAAVFALDLLKGVVPPLLAQMNGEPLPHTAVACGVATILGHSFPCWLGFQGGKGVATSLGVVLVLAPVAALIALAVFVAVLVWTRIVSLGSMLSVVAFAIYQTWALGLDGFSSRKWSIGLFSLAAPALILIRHRGNLRRLLRGTEPNIVDSPPTTADGPPAAPPTA